MDKVDKVLKIKYENTIKDFTSISINIECYQHF